MAEKEKKKAGDISETEEKAAGDTAESGMTSEAEETEEQRDGVEEEQTKKPGEEDGESEDAPEVEDASDDEGVLDGEDALEGEEAKTWAERRAAKKQAKLDKKTDALKEQIEQLEDRVKRQMAEFENFRKRTEREKQAMFETGARSVIEKILPIVDNFERGLATVPEANSEDPFVDGMNRIYKQLLTELDNIGVKAIEAVGQEFDPNLHNAVMQVASEEYESGVVAQELQKGYTYRDTVVRHSMVAVVE